MCSAESRPCTWLHCHCKAVRLLGEEMALCPEHAAHLQAAVDAGHPTARDALRLAVGREVRDGVVVCY